MPGIKVEFMVFVLAFISGAVVRVVYKCISCLRILVAHHPAVVGLEDFLYWSGTAFYLFVQMYHTSNGSIRWYFILGVVLGAVLTSVLVKKFEKFCIKKTGRHENKSDKTIDKRGKRR